MSQPDPAMLKSLGAGLAVIALPSWKTLCAIGCVYCAVRALLVGLKFVFIQVATRELTVLNATMRVVRALGLGGLALCTVLLVVSIKNGNVNALLSGTTHMGLQHVLAAALALVAFKASLQGEHDSTRKTVTGAIKSSVKGVVVGLVLSLVGCVGVGLKVAESALELFVKISKQTNLEQSRPSVRAVGSDLLRRWMATFRENARRRMNQLKNL